jgi:hypothetical protein
MVFTDQELVEKTRGGDNAAFGELWGRYERQVTRLCRGYVSGSPRDPAVDEHDLAADVFIRALHRLDRYEDRSAVSPPLQALPGAAFAAGDRGDAGNQCGQRREAGAARPGAPAAAAGGSPRAGMGCGKRSSAAAASAGRPPHARAAARRDRGGLPHRLGPSSQWRRNAALPARGPAARRSRAGDRVAPGLAAGAPARLEEGSGIRRPLLPQRTLGGRAAGLRCGAGPPPRLRGSGLRLGEMLQHEHNTNEATQVYRCWPTPRPSATHRKSPHASRIIPR